MEVVSPDGNVKLTLGMHDRLEPYPAGSRVYYSVSVRGRPVILDSPLGLDFRNMPPLASDLVVKAQDSQAIDEMWERVCGKSKQVRNHCNQLRIVLEETVAPVRRLELVVRAYNDGVALRYGLPKQRSIGQFSLVAERTWFRFAGNHAVWAANYGGTVSPQESEFKRARLSELNGDEVYGLPLLVQVDNDLWAAIAEADLQDWAGMYVTRVPNSSNTLVTALAPRQDDPTICVKSQSPRSSPWRVILLGRRPGDLIESDLIDNLNPACEIKDPSWIKPGRCAWDWWWCGKYAPDADFSLGSNTATMKYFIDFAASMGWEYQLVDWQWYGAPFDPNTDITRQNPDINIPELVAYAKDKGVRLLLWLFWEKADKQLDEALALYEKWGIAGIKIDFMNRDDQEMVNFYHRVISKAAEHKLLVDFHGAYKPTGTGRTWPNQITREGVMGNEYNKWSSRVTPEHCLTLPFTRMLTGPMDFTPGGFRHGTHSTFKVVGGDAPAPMVMGTRCFQLAMMVVYDSPLQVLCDSPYAYRDSPAGLDFLKIVPCTWDRTKVVDGQVGQFICMARQSGNDWYVGAMTDWTARALEIPLDFLGQGTYEATIWSDAPDANDHPENLVKDTRSVTSKDRITSRLASGGGQVICLRPQAGGQR
jgi:alpha-glucosidase